MTNAISIWCIHRRDKTHETIRELSNQSIKNKLTIIAFVIQTTYAIIHKEQQREHYLQIEACKSFRDEGQARLISRCPRNPRRRHCRRWGRQRYKTSPHRSVWPCGWASSVQHQSPRWRDVFLKNSPENTTREGFSPKENHVQQWDREDIFIGEKEKIKP
jgi:hypothetical protein